MLPATIHWYLMRRDNFDKDKEDTTEVAQKYTPAELGEMGEYSPLYRYTL